MLFPCARIAQVAASGAAVTALTLTSLTGCGSEQSATPTTAPGAPITSTTRIASAGVLGNQRRPDESCAPAPAPGDPAARVVRNAPAAGVPATTEVSGDPQRIVALSGDQLDALCALGLQGRIVGTTQPAPSYLGGVIHGAPGVGDAVTPDLDAIGRAAPDLILGSSALTPSDFDPLARTAPTVFTGAPGAGWQDTLRTVAAAVGRPEAADRLLDGFTQDAHKTGQQNDATHFQASVVQFTQNTVRVYGADNFPASVLRAVGVDRPAAQRFTDKPYIELAPDGDLSAADGDIVYLSFDSPAAKDRAAAVLDSPAWRKLSANRDNRVFIVNNEVWQTGGGVVAARGILDDLRWLNAPIN
ncbi:FEIII-dicitrate-binding periplasmic lipoprotein FecB [Mycolicibacterium canariasense]|uniref:FEIII-dicitrate-binding periplasmic lipoprotein FecB n=1 Tax=Mycolicibacterium canariasense TaxID=228230 RepID=A0A124E1Y0_MYCCR|nr:iron-siderophore ABC transporter substrate-binding protein [Mycolicibacterium canariasense]MCV7209392.1 iron-siderophore ABC transporter substrate-binding protein [Mycolicibacterium canariasense]GAS95075.1 FEIII-dicitrate-binding periplasmic lipoprotein FecB [Mycolicibacterium canariasense]